MSDAELVARLGSVPLFSGLDQRHLKDLANRARVVEHPAGREIVEEGGGSVGFHLLLEGTAKVTQGDQVRRTIGPGDYFGEISLIDGKPRSATVRAETPVRSLSLTAWQFAPVLEANPSMSHSILLGLCKLIREAEGRSDL